MKKVILIFVFAFFSCNFPMSDSDEDLPNNYMFSYEGGRQNRIVRDNQFVIDSGAVSASFDDKYIFFSEDTTYSMEPKKVSKKILRYYICNISKDTLSKPLSYDYFRKFIIENKINEDIDISKD